MRPLTVACCDLDVAVAQGSCASVPLMAMYGMAPLAGLDGGGFLADVVLVPYADAMLIAIPTEADPVAIASMSDNIPDGWRTVGPYRAELAALPPADRRVLVMAGCRSRGPVRHGAGERTRGASRSAGSACPATALTGGAGRRPVGGRCGRGA